MIRCLVFGFHKQPPNLGDYLFIEAFKHLFPKLEFQFTDHITAGMLKDIPVIIFGGGSFIDQAPDITPEALRILKRKVILYIGVGIETEICQIHQDLMRQAKLVAIRSNHITKAKAINPNTILIPDLVYSLWDQRIKAPKINKSILFIPNINVVPKWDEPYWKHLSFHRFQLEVSQTLDKLYDDGYIIKFYPMSLVANQNDNNAAIEIINQMKNYIPLDLPNCSDIASITKLFSQYDLIITQRFHGAVLAEMVGVPYICLYHHDKLRHTTFDLGSFISYFEVSKEKLLKEIDIRTQYSTDLLLKTNIFEELVAVVEQCLKDLSA